MIQFFALLLRENLPTPSPKFPLRNVYVSITVTPTEPLALHQD